jgi:hypothetical protein
LKVVVRDGFDKRVFDRRQVLRHLVRDRISTVLTNEPARILKEPHHTFEVVGAKMFEGILNAVVEGAACGCGLVQIWVGVDWVARNAEPVT